MIRISVMYVNEPGKNFDWDYYLKKHIPMVHRLLDPLGLVRSEIDKATDPSSPFIAVGHMVFNSIEDCHNSFLNPTYFSEIAADVVNYTDAPAQMQISEIIK
jgi:uncharacterized protein (TIGR02118 family)